MRQACRKKRLSSVGVELGRGKLAADRLLGRSGSVGHSVRQVSRSGGQVRSVCRPGGQVDSPLGGAPNVGLGVSAHLSVDASSVE